MPPLLGLLLAGLVASGLIEGLPSFLRAAIVLLLFTYLPGDVIVTRLFGVRLSNMPARLAAAFAAGLAFYSVLTWLCWMAGFSFRLYSGLIQAITVLGWAAVLLYRLPHRPEPEAQGERATGWAIVVIALAVAIFYAVAPAPLTHRGDGFDHISYIRAIGRENALAPQGVLAPPVEDAPEVKSDPRKGTLHPLLAVACNASYSNPVYLWRTLPAVFAPAAVMAFWAFVVRLLPMGVYAPFALVLFLMFQGGLARHFLGNVAYGQHLSMVLYWTLAALCFGYAREQSGRVLLLVLAIAFGAAAVHFDALLHFGLLVLSIVIFHRWFGLSFGAAAVLGAGAAVVAVVMLAWKLSVSVGAANMLHTHPQGLLYLGDIGSRWFVPSPVEILKRYGLLFLVGMMLVPLLLLPRRRRESALKLLALAAPPMLLAMNPLVAPLIFEKGTYLLHRFVLNVPAFATTALLLGCLIEWSREGRLLRKAFVFVLVVAWARVFMLSYGAWSKDLQRVRFGWSPVAGAAMQALADYIDENSGPGTVIMSDPVTSYTLTALGNTRAVSVLHQHANPNDPLGEQRVAAVRNALSPYALQRDLLLAVRRFNVKYIVLNARAPGRSREFMAEWSPALALPVAEKIATADETFRLVYDADQTAIYRVVGPDPATPTWYPTVPFVQRPPADLQQCEGRQHVAPLDVVGVAIDPPSGVAGEKVTMTVAYRRNKEVPAVSMPLKLRIRMEDPEYFAGARHYIGDKYVRRFRERRDALFHRFRFDRKPFGGLLHESLWPLGGTVCETFELTLPTDLRESEYVLHLRLDHEPLVPNFALKDLFFNRDSYVAPACARISITLPPGGIKHIEPQ